MRTVYKYPLEVGRTELKMPVGATVLDVQMQSGKPTLWALIDLQQQAEERRIFDVYGTGHRMPNFPGAYIATVQTFGGNLVWHVFDATLAG